MFFVTKYITFLPTIFIDDSRKDKRYAMEEEKDPISIEKLAKIIAESMHTFWEFLRKDETSTNLKAPQQTLVEPADSRLLMDVRKDFQKVFIYIYMLSKKEFTHYSVLFYIK